MIKFICCCGTEVFFENSHCTACGKVLGFDPQTLNVLALQVDDGAEEGLTATGQRYRFCQSHQQLGCNWLVSPQDSNPQCWSCRTTRTIPTLALLRNKDRWQCLEQTKRWALYMILRLRLPLNIQGVNVNEATPALSGLPPLIFDFLEDKRSNPDVTQEFVYSGHSEGVITINAAEADDSFRATNRELMNELYRTLLGHFRHELGHYYGMLLQGAELDEFRQLFGDERTDYQNALSRYYEEGAKPDCLQNYISTYAASHPLEDWAETWAHYLHIRDTLETAEAYQLIEITYDKGGLELALTGWAKLTVMLNALNRSMGVEDAYPFVITPVIRQKLGFIDRLVRAWQVPDHNAARQ